MARKSAFPRGSEAAARQFLFASGQPVNSTNGAYVRRVANAVQRQQSAGLPVSRSAARGHRVTPEHPGRRRPILPRPAADYAPPPPRGRSKYRAKTQPFQPKPRIARPRYHGKRDAFRGRFAAFNQGIVDVLSDQRKAMQRLREIQQLDPRGRVEFEVYDCTTRRRAKLFANPPSEAFHVPDPGIQVDHLLRELFDRGMTLEEYLIHVDAERAGSANSSGIFAKPLTHICLYYLTYYPAATLATTRRRRATNRRLRDLRDRMTP